MGESDEIFELEPEKELILEAESATPEEDLESLGLNWKKLKGKLILDIDAGAANMAEAAKKEKVKIISLDKNPESYILQGQKIPDTLPYIKGDATMMPFADETFDLIISIAAPPSSLESKEDAVKTIKEFERVLKKGGEARFYAHLNFETLEDDALVLKSNFPMDEVQYDQWIKEIRKKSVEVLKKINKNIKVKFNKKKNESYCVLKK